MKKFLAVLKARTMEYVRDRGTFLWNLFFPILMVAGFAFAFGTGESKTLFKVALIGEGGADALKTAIADRSFETGSAAMDGFLAIPQLELIAYGGADRDAALDKLRKHQFDMAVDFAGGAWYINDQAAGGPLLRKLLTGSEDPGTDGAMPSVPGFTEKRVSGKAIRYVDYLVPGVIGMNMMFSCLFGVGFVLVRYRKNGVLKRLKATPVGALNFLTAQAVSRMIIVVLTSVFVFAATNFFLHFRMEGNYLTLLLVLTLGIFAMISLGLVFASRLASEELASGLMNLVTFPMMVFSGVFFSIEGSPAILRAIAKVFPLTHFLDAARAIMLDGAGLAAVWPQMAVLSGMTVLFLAVSASLFKWE